MSDLEKMDSVLDAKVSEKRSRYSSTNKAGLARTSFTIKEELTENLRALAYLNRSSMKSELERILESYFSANPIDSKRLPGRLPEQA